MRRFLLVAVVGLAVAFSMGQGQLTAHAVGAITFDGSPGTGAPPSTLGPYTMTSFGLDSRSELATVTDVPDPAGTITFDTPMTHLKIGSSWATWSNGYAGDVYANFGAAVILTMPAHTSAFYFYAEPNPFAVLSITATAQDGTTSGPINVNGYYGAQYFGFYAVGGSSVATIAVSSSVDFAVGEFGISAGCASNSKNYVATGDSIPFGAELSEGTNYPTHLLTDHLIPLDASYCSTNLAQSGASTANYRSGGGTFNAQLQPTLDANAKLVTVTVGVDNKVLPTLANQCLPKLASLDFAGARSCETSLLNDTSAWNSLATDLKAILVSYRSSLSSNPELYVAITNYYNPMPSSISSTQLKAFCDQLSPGVAGQCNGLLGQMNSALGAANGVLNKLNQTIANTVSPFTSSSTHFIFVNIHDTFVGHCSVVNMSVSISPYGGSASGNLGCASSKSWIEPATIQSGGGSKQIGPFTFSATGSAQAGVHPNDAGHNCISNLVWEAVKNRLGSSEASKSSPC